MTFLMRAPKPLDDVLDHHHRAVDQHPDCDGESAQAHQIGGQAHAAHEQEGDERRHRQGCSHDRGGTPVAQEQDEQDDDEDRAEVGGQ